VPDSKQTNCARLLWVLPLAQVAFAEFCWYMDAHSHRPVRADVYWVPTLDLFCKGWNAPAYHMNFILDALEDFRGGVALGNIQYMLLVAALWYLVARKICRFQAARAQRPDDSSVTKISIESLVMLYGIYMLLVILLHNMVFTPTHFNAGITSNFVGDILRQSLFFLWSLALIVVPAATLFTAVRKKKYSWI
jgi:hypothetical protein